jgi:hypothetical protein
MTAPANWIYPSAAAAEADSNAMYLALYPSGTTELLYGWIEIAPGQFQLHVPTGFVDPRVAT